MAVGINFIQLFHNRYRDILFNILFYISILSLLLLVINLLTNISSINFEIFKISFSNLPALINRFILLSLLSFFISPDKFKKKTIYFNYFLFFIIFSFFIRWSYYHPDHDLVIQSDGVGYYSYIRSIVIDRDLDFENEYKALWPDRFGTPQYHMRTDTGYIPNYFSVGPSLLWTPFFSAAHITTHILKHFGHAIEADGYSGLYVLFCSFGSMVYCFFGIIFVYQFLRIYFSPNISFLASSFILLGTSLTYYMAFELFMAHIHSFFIISLLMLFLFKYFDYNVNRHWALLAFFLGLAAIIRWQNISYIIIIFLYIINDIAKHSKNNMISKDNIYLIKKLFLFLIVLFFTVLPQLIVFRILFGFWLGVPQGNCFIVFNIQKIIYVLFSSHNGLFHWHPIVLISTAGLIISAFSSLKNSLLLLTLIIQIYINSLPLDWWAGHAFGMRRMINSSIIIAFGLAFLINTFSKNKQWISGISYYSLILICISLCIINLLMVLAYTRMDIPHGVAFSFQNSIVSAYETFSEVIMKPCTRLAWSLIFFAAWLFFFQYKLKDSII